MADPTDARTAGADLGLSDEGFRRRIFDEHDPVRLAQLVHAYYGDLARAGRATRELLYFHLGMLAGAIVRLASNSEGEGAPRAWQPIDTTPKTGQVLLFYPPQRGLPARVHICDDWKSVGPTRTFFTPTHWMPLPAPPQTAPAVREDADSPIVPLRETTSSSSDS